MSMKIGNLELKSRVYVPPMAGVTDLVFRNVVRRVDRHCLLATEMVSSKSLLYRKENRIMDIAPDEHPIGIQVFGHEPDVMASAGRMAEKKGVDFLDINMGCPVPKITKGKDGAALMREPELARQIIEAVVAAVTVPVTVKFRLGWDDDARNCVEFAQMAEAAGVSAITVHGRTRQQRYAGKADWTWLSRVKKAVSVPVFGNGDVFEPEDGLRLLETSGCDGVAVARGTLGNPWLIPRITQLIETGRCDDPPTAVDRLITAYHHCAGLIRYKGLRVGTNESRRHLVHYTKGIRNSASYRARLTQVAVVSDVTDILSEFAGVVGGRAGLDAFLQAVENYKLEDHEYIGKRDGDRTDGVKSKVDVKTVAPVAQPEHAIDK
jgi:tRNA-dihydrouridine synthase B